MPDIESRADLESLMASFYERLLHDNSISPIFTDIAKIDLPSHLPKIVSFWEQMLFGTGNYRENVMAIHIDLDKQLPFTEHHFEIWLGHLYETTDELFAGEKAETLKTRALSIANMMKIKTIYKD